MVATSQARPALLLAALLFGAAEPAIAQGLEIGAAYQYLHVSESDEGRSFPLGFNVDVAFPLARLTVVGEVGWARRSESYEDLFADVETVLHYAGGMRWTLNTVLSPYVQALFGAQRTSTVLEFQGNDIADDSFTDAMFGVDGGVAVRVFGLRVFGAAGYRRVFGDEGGTNGFRALAGARFGFGGS